ncbi:MAG: ABC transporter permease [Desulfurococcaceae archaeon]
MPVSLNYVVKRLILSFLVIIGVAIISYIILIVTPGDPAVKWAGNPRGPGATEAIELARKELGLDKPLHVQVLNFAWNVLTGNLGLSIATKQPVTQVIYTGFTSTLELLVFTYALAIPLGVFLGFYAALKRGSIVDQVVMSMGVILASTPSFWFATVLLALFSITGLKPYGRISKYLQVATGFQPITGFYLLDSMIQGNWIVFMDVLTRMIPACIAVSVYPIGTLSRVVRTLVAESLLEDYVKAAVAWGIDKSTILRAYILRSIIPPLVQIAGLSFAYSLVDAMVVEAVLGREGLGQLLLTSIRETDFRVAVGLITYVAMFFIVVNTLVDVLQSYIDPRVRL